MSPKLFTAILKAYSEENMDHHIPEDRKKDDDLLTRSSTPPELQHRLSELADKREIGVWIELFEDRNIARNPSNNIY